jgi:spermidine synthase
VNGPSAGPQRDSRVDLGIHRAGAAAVSTAPPVTTTPTGEARSSGAALLAAVLVAGAGTMTVELSAVRLLAPWFGASAGVWTNVIGVVLLALAIGYLLGARLSAGARPTRRLAVLLALAGVCAAALPALAGPVAHVFMPEGVPLHEAAGLLVWGSLATTIVLFLPAALLLGAVGPLAVEATQRARGGGAGAAGGRVLALSTLGSLAGTFGTTHVLIPSLGVRATFLTAAGALLLASAVVGVAERRNAPRNGYQGLSAPLLGLVLGGALVIPGYAPPGARAGERELVAVDSAYQRVRVLESGTGADRMRYLRVNESLDSFQSVWAPEPGLLPPGFYYDHFALPLAFEGAEAAPARWDIAVVGLGAGTTVRVLEGVVAAGTELGCVGFEIDPVVLALAREHFELRDVPGREYFGGLDGRAGLALVTRTFDQVVLDAYANNMEIPPHLATVEFFREVARVLRPGGWVTANLGGFGADDPVVAAVARSAAEGLGAVVHLARVPFSRNVTLLARIGAEVPEPGGPGWRFAPHLDTLRGPLELPGAWTRHLERHGGTRLTDDRCPMEWLQLRSIEEATARWASRS